MYVGDDALNDVAPARAMGMVSVWYKQEDAEIEPLEEEVDFTITTVEELLTILPIKMIIKEKIMDLFTRKDGTSIHYSTLGEGYPIVLIHTVLDNYSVFNKLAAELAKSFQVVLIDLRGHGYSDKPRHIEIKDFF